jgi:hypothetical protein
VLFRVAIVLVAVGVIAGILTLLPIFTGSAPLPVGWYLAALLAPLGIGLMLVGLWRNARAGKPDV